MDPVDKNSHLPSLPESKIPKNSGRYGPPPQNRETELTSLLSTTRLFPALEAGKTFSARLTTISQPVKSSMPSHLRPLGDSTKPAPQLPELPKKVPTNPGSEALTARTKQTSSSESLPSLSPEGARVATKSVRFAPDKAALSLEETANRFESLFLTISRDAIRKRDLRPDELEKLATASKRELDRLEKYMPMLDGDSLAESETLFSEAVDILRRKSQDDRRPLSDMEDKLLALSERILESSTDSISFPRLFALFQDFYKAAHKLMHSPDGRISSSTTGRIIKKGMTNLNVLFRKSFLAYYESGRAPTDDALKQIRKELYPKKR